MLLMLSKFTQLKITFGDNIHKELWLTMSSPDFLMWLSIDQPIVEYSKFSFQKSLVMNPKGYKVEWTLPMPQSVIKMWTYIVVVWHNNHYDQHGIPKITQEYLLFCWTKLLLPFLKFCSCCLCHTNMVNYYSLTVLIYNK